MAIKKTSWGAVANWYDEMLEDSKDSFQAKVILPNLLRIVDPKPGMTILDVACGQGYFSRAFAEKGAKVVGCDISPELIDLAKKNSPKETDFHVAPADSLNFINKDSSTAFDIAVIVLALQNIENITGTLSECARVLKPGGRLVVVLNHPAFRIPQSSSWQWDMNSSTESPFEKGGARRAGDFSRQYRRIDSYMSEKRLDIDMTPGEADQHKKKFTVSFHRPLQSYFKAINKAGFSVTRMEEWISHKKSQEGPRAVEEDRIRKEIPMFLCIEGVKGC